MARLRGTGFELARTSWQAALDLLFPPHCVGCRRGRTIWCSDCSRSTVPWPPHACAVCGGNSGHSGECLVANSPALLRAYSAYQGPLARALIHMKYRPNRSLASVMAGWLHELVRELEWSPDLVVPVPLGVLRQRSRGYNQIALVAEELAGFLGAAFGVHALERIRETPSQVGLNASERRANVAGAFRAHAGTVQDRTVLVVDDLITTGATLDACARALLAAGAAKLYGVGLASPRKDRAPREQDGAAGIP